jgi:hypothetical protein
LGLERYVSAFRDNDVDGEVLPELTADDLIAIGVTSVGHSRKLLAAIAALGGVVPVAAAAKSHGLNSAIGVVVTPTQGNRGQGGSV